ncbi:hypothetical protein EYF80_036131 [Liparis tanakae]|uniref:Uncharacterized protein n=1 Tax=Liparis tanakae TaxID=230148 RepID=A0A4Z2GK73_9TELE|nr:hypothetical protein EYF80_036131 [Liparis tanakae]
MAVCRLCKVAVFAAVSALRLQQRAVPLPLCRCRAGLSAGSDVTPPPSAGPGSSARDAGTCLEEHAGMSQPSPVLSPLRLYHSPPPGRHHSGCKASALQPRTSFLYDPVKPDDRRLTEIEM